MPESGSQRRRLVQVRMEGGRGKEGRAVMDAGVSPGGKEETQWATEGLQNMGG